MDSEKELADKLKKQCFPNGREINPKVTAEIIHQLGLVYGRKRPDKISLVQSAVLLNAAIIREPENVTAVENDLRNLISDVLLLANASEKDIDLIKFSSTIRDKLKNFRGEVESKLFPRQNESMIGEEKTRFRNEKVCQVAQLQRFINERYRSIMQEINDFCIDAMGKPPCRYALIGMGSLAHEQITPYSDFESAIVLENGSSQETLEYFRWCAVLFQLVLACLQETIIKFVAIECLNDPTRPGGDWFYDAFTPCGVCSDGFSPEASKHPLGRHKTSKDKPWTTELIKSVSGMVTYLDSEEDKRNGYHLADVLSKTCFVAGDGNIYEQFCKESQAQLERNRFYYQTKWFAKAEADLKRFNAVEMLGHWFSRQLDVKRLLYRTSTLFVSGLGRQFDIYVNSHYDALDALVAKEAITQDQGIYFKYAVAISCEARLRTYMKTQGQNDVYANNPSKNAEVKMLEQLLGKWCIVDYFQTVRSFQQFLKELTDAKGSRTTKLRFKGRFLQPDPFFSSVVCGSISLIDHAVSFLRQALNHFESSENVTQCDMTEYMGVLLLSQGRIDEARSYTEKAIDAKRKVIREETDRQLIRCKRNLGLCLMATNDFEAASRVFQEIFVQHDDVCLSEEVDLQVADCMHRAGMCFLGLNNFDNALRQFERELTVRQATTDDKVFGPCCKIIDECSADLTECLLFLGHSMRAAGRANKALCYFLKALSMRRKISTDETVDRDVGNTYFNISYCYLDIHKLQHALEYGVKTFEISRKSQGLEKFSPLPSFFRLLGEEFLKAGKRADAVRCFTCEYELYEIYQESGSAKANSAYNVGRCYLGRGDTEQALAWFVKCLHMRRELRSSECAPLDVPRALYSVGSCYFLLRKLEEAIGCFKELKSMGDEVLSDVTCADHRRLLVHCFMLAKRFDEAYAELEEILKYSPSDFDIQVWQFYCTGHLFVGLYDKERGRYAKALLSFQQEKLFRLTMRQTESNAHEARKLRECDRNIGICLFKLKRYQQALNSFVSHLEP